MTSPAKLSRTITIIAAVGLAAGGCAGPDSSDAAGRSATATSSISASESPSGSLDAAWEEPSPTDYSRLSKAELVEVSTVALTMGTWLDGVVGTPNGPRPAGFGNAVPRPIEGKIAIAWKGSPDSAIQNKLANPPKGVEIEMLPAEYTWEEMQAAGQSMVVSADGMIGDTGWQVVGYRKSWVGAGVITEVVPPQGHSEDSVPHAITQQLQDTTDVKVQAEVTEQRVTAMGQRWNASSPWASGIGLGTPTGMICSSGFGGTGSDGSQVFLAAAHCGENKGGLYSASNGSSDLRQFGVVYGSIHERDTVLIGMTNGGTVAGQIMDGAWNASPTDYHPVSGWQWAQLNWPVCSSGANTGVHCPLYVQEVNTAIAIKDFGNVYNVDKVGSSPDIVFGQGDSGGPMFMLSTDNKRWGLGTISAGYGEAPCPPTAVPTTCFTDGYYAELGWALDMYKMSLTISQ